MTCDEYILQIISKYRIWPGNDTPAYKAAIQLLPILQEWAGTQLNEIFVSGSYAKDTGIRGSTDIDLFISLKSDTTETLKEIYDSLHKWLDVRNLSPRKQNVSIGLKYSGFSIDLVPGKKQPGNTNDHSLFKNKSQTWTQTNVQKHINLISGSGRLNEIRAIKIWRNLNKLDFSSFYLELVVLNALYSIPTNQLSTNVFSIFAYLRDNFASARIIDPSNTNNIISDDLTSFEKGAIKAIAQGSCTKKTWEEILW